MAKDLSESLADTLLQTGGAESTETAEPTDVTDTTTDTTPADAPDTDDAGDATGDETPTDEGDGEPTTSPTTEEDAQWIKENSDRFGYDLSKFKSREEAMGGLVNLAKKLSARDEDAAIGRQLMGAIGDRHDEFTEWASGKTAAAATTPTGAQKDDFATYTPDELQQIIEEGNVEGASTADGKRSKEAQSFVYKRLLAMATQPAEFLKQHGVDPAAQTASFEERIAQEKDVRERQDWISSHAKDLWVDGTQEKGLTKLGIQAQEILKRFGAPDTPASWQAAMETARSMMPKATPRRGAKGAQHRAAVSTTPSTGKTLATELKDVLNEDERVSKAAEYMADQMFPDG